MANEIISQSLVTSQIQAAYRLSLLDDAALLAEFDRNPARIKSFLLGFDLAYNATRVADLAEALETRLLLAVQNALQ